MLYLNKEFSLETAAFDLNPGVHKITAVQYDLDDVVTSFEVDFRIEVLADDLYEAL